MNGEWEPIIFNPNGGVNSELPDTLINDSELRTARNFLFERQFALTRPGLTVIGPTGVPLNDVILEAHSLYVGGSIFNLVLTNTAAGGSFIYRLTNAAYTQLIPGALSFGTPYNFFKPVAINGVVLIGGASAGIQRWVTSGTTLTTITTAKPVFLTGHFSRAVGAYDRVGANGPITVEWSKAGDETTWNTSPSTDGSGLVLLTEIPDVITGLENLHSVLVVMRTLGITLGYPTGVAIPAFRFEMYTRDYGGSPYPRTLATYNNILYYVGRDNVYTFDLRNITPIGDELKSNLFANIISGVNWSQYKGFITTFQRSGEIRSRYHLFPNSVGSVPHFTYDIEDNKWSIHTYTPQAMIGLNYLEAAAPALKEGFAWIDGASTSPNVFAWDNAVGVEQPAFMISKTFRTPKYDRDMRVERVLMSYKDQGLQNSPVTVTVSGRIGTNVKSQADSQPVGLNNDQHWQRQWWNPRTAVGQDMQVRIDVPANMQFQTDHIEIVLAEEGGLRK